MEVAVYFEGKAEGLQPLGLKTVKHELALAYLKRNDWSDR